MVCAHAQKKNNNKNPTSGGYEGFGCGPKTSPDLSETIVVCFVLLTRVGATARMCGTCDGLAGLVFVSASICSVIGCFRQRGHHLMDVHCQFSTGEQGKCNCVRTLTELWSR